MKRCWKEIPDFGGRFQVSSDGLVRSLPDIAENGRIYGGKVLKSNICVKGYEQIALHWNGAVRYTSAHRLVAEAFILNSEGKPEVNHINGIKLDNRVENLEWVTSSENQKHRYRVLKKTNKQKGRTGYLCKNSKTVRGVSIATGNTVEFGSASEAAREMGFDQSGISAAARGVLRQYKGYRWFYIGGVE